MEGHSIRNAHFGLHIISKLLLYSHTEIMGFVSSAANITVTKNSSLNIFENCFVLCICRWLYSDSNSLTPTGCSTEFSSILTLHGVGPDPTIYVAQSYKASLTSDTSHKSWMFISHPYFCLASYTFGGSYDDSFLQV